MGVTTFFAIALLLAPSQVTLKHPAVGACSAVAHVPLGRGHKAGFSWSPRQALVQLRLPKGQRALAARIKSLGPELIKSVVIDGPALQIQLANRGITAALTKVGAKRNISLCLRRTLLDDTKTLALSLRPFPGDLVAAPAVPSALEVKAPQNVQDATHVQAWSDFALTPARPELLREALKKAPRSPFRFRTIYLLARKAYQAGKMAEAEDLSREAAALAPAPYNLLFASMAALVNEPNTRLLTPLISQGGELGTKALAWRGVSRWRAGQFALASRDLIDAQNKLPVLAQAPGLGLLIAEALRLQGQSEAARKQLQSLAQDNRPDCALAAARWADLAAIEDDSKEITAALRACSNHHGTGAELLALRSFEFGGGHDAMSEALPYEKLIRFKRAPAFDDDIRQRWARALYLRGDDDAAFWVLHAAHEPTPELLQVIGSAAVSRAVDEGRNLDAAMETTLIPENLRDNDLLRQSGVAFAALDLPQRQVEVLLLLVQRQKEKAPLSDLLALAQAYRASGQVVRLRLLQEYLQERGESAFRDSDANNQGPLNDCARKDNAFAQARCHASKADDVQAKRDLAALSTAGPALQKALELMPQAKSNDPAEVQP